MVQVDESPTRTLSGVFLKTRYACASGASNSPGLLFWCPSIV
jgi:hypothetical protein